MPTLPRGNWEREVSRPANNSVPDWAYDLVADLIYQEEIHPKLFRELPGGGFEQWTWCPAVALERVPDHIQHIAGLVARTRKQTCRHER